MKFSKLLTTAMMSVALVASSSAFAAEETPWWSMDFDGLAIEEGGTLTNTLNTAYGTEQNGVWSTEEGDLTTFENDKLKLNTQGTDLTWTPNGDNNTKAITYIDADVTFVGSDTAPTISETDVHTAVYLKNIINDETGEVASSVLCAWVRTGTEDATWVELSGYVIKDGGEYNLRIMLDDINLSFFIEDTLLTGTDGVTTKFKTAKDGYAGAVDSVSFRGTGFVDNFAASQKVKEAAATANVVAYKVFKDNVDVTSSWQGEDFLFQSFGQTELILDGTPSNVAFIWDEAQDFDGGFTSLGKVAAIKLVADGESYEGIFVDGALTGDTNVLSVETGSDGGYVYYTVVVDTDDLTVANAEYTLEVYYGEYTPSEDPDPDPEVPAVEPDPIKISAISLVGDNVVVTVVPATEGGKIKAGVNYWAVVSATLGGDETAQDPVTVPEDTNSLQITVPATGDSLFIKVKADTATAK
ncbi:MAG: hypothetical protein IJ444_03145 [Kiritimatiellae bacterium]|nr:hypothetical protein [Kiritimatiellia bacterium]